MKTSSTIFLFLVSIILSYSQVLFHPINFINENGDTINRQNNHNQFTGLQIISDNPGMLVTDSNYYQKGYFINGKPDGEWIIHEASGKYSKGSYLKKHFTTDSIMFDIKAGFWVEYTKNRKIIEQQISETCIHKNYRIKTIKTFKDSSDYKLLFFQKEKLLKDSSFKIVEQTKYNYNGKISKKTTWNVHVKKTKTYYSLGTINSIKAKERRSYKTNIYKYKMYDTNGKLESKNKSHIGNNYIKFYKKKGNVIELK